MMRIPTVAGMVLLVVGALMLLLDISFLSRQDVLDVGGLTVTASERRPLAPWVGGVALLAGAALVLTGIGRKSRS